MSYGARTGVTALMRYIKLLCRLYLKFASSIRAWIESHTSGTDQTTILDWLDKIAIVCVIMDSIPDD